MCFDHDTPYFPLDDPEAVQEAHSRRLDRAIGGLPREGVYLDLFEELQALGGPDAAMRVREALRTYHQAISATIPDAAVMMFVTSIEALIVPRPEWRKDKVTKRFVRSLSELCPAKVDELATHTNVEDAFEWQRKGAVGRQRRELLERIYDLRSTPTHSGLGMSPNGMDLLNSPDGMRITLLSDLARAAILGFIQAPRSSLIGHPGIDPVGAETQTSRPPNPLTPLMLLPGCEIDL